MKNLFLITAFFLNTTSFAQTVEKAPNTFVRVYDVTYLGDMVAKGKIISISDSSIQLLHRFDTINIQASTIGRIETKRSFNENVGRGALIGVSAGAFIGFVGGTDCSNSGALLCFDRGTTAGFGAFFGFGLGSVCGAIRNLFNNSAVYYTNGDMDNWQAFKGNVSN